VVCATAEAKGMCCDSTFYIAGGTVNVTVSGLQSKAIKAQQAITLSGGDITVKTSGGVALVKSGSGYDPSYCTSIKGNGDIYINGANISINGAGISNKGI